MKCYNCSYRETPGDPVPDPYPAPDTAVVTVALRSSLVLFRPREGLTTCEGHTPRDGEDLYLTGAPFRVVWTDDDGTERAVTVPAGFVTDLTSVPALLRGLVSRAGPWLEAAVVHDYLYVAWQDVGRPAIAADRRFADQLMLAAMTASGVRLWRRFAIFAVVRLFGGVTYREEDCFRFGDRTDPRLVHLANVPDLVLTGTRTT